MSARRWLLCAEDLLSATLAKELVDRVVRERAPEQWLRDLWDPEGVHLHREWVGVRPDQWWADRSALDRICEEHEIAIAVRDRESGRRRAPHGKASMAFKAARAAQSLTQPPELLVLSGDTDGAIDPTLYFEEGLRMADYNEPSVCANIHRESEAWLIAGFVPQNNAEREALQRACDTLEFDPTLQPERLLSNVSGDERDCKRVARTLFDPSGGFSLRNPRVQACWSDTPLALLEERGERAGIKNFIEQVQTVVLRSLVQ